VFTSDWVESYVVGKQCPQLVYLDYVLRNWSIARFPVVGSTFIVTVIVSLLSFDFQEGTATPLSEDLWIDKKPPPNSNGPIVVAKDPFGQSCRMIVGIIFPSKNLNN
jgi:hypothetical protein